MNSLLETGCVVIGITVLCILFIAVVIGASLGVDWLFYQLYNYAVIPLGGPHLGFWQFVAIVTIISWLSSLLRPTANKD